MAAKWILVGSGAKYHGVVGAMALSAMSPQNTLRVDAGAGTLPHAVYSEVAHIAGLNQIVTLSTMEEDRDANEFLALANNWKKSAPRHMSLSADLARDPNYMRIVGMGERAIPFILRQMHSEMIKGEPDHWFMALWAITGENPIPVASRGKVRQMARAWIEWGVKRGHLDAAVGESFSKA